MRKKKREEVNVGEKETKTKGESTTSRTGGEGGVSRSIKRGR